MKRSQLTEEVFKMRFIEVNDRFQKKQLSSEEAADLLGISISTFYRKRKRSEEEDFQGNLVTV